MTTVSVTQARANLYDLIDKVSTSGKPVGITNKGQTKAILISPEELRSWEVTMEVMNDKELMEQIRESKKDIKAGRIYSLDEVEKELRSVRDVSGKPIKSGKKKSKKA
ncbi:type II toxin-antitoxin system Phd/YefM family antitoxin [Candidatus Daviesbacteria bacterium]|nr:type II toxin-antitoxin system Phd/YefM family antitoxin [Candidatus Daviesbacteria bacterium]